jgi:sarcosine oxidase subunit beta
MTESYDAIVIGGGVVGVSTLYHLADLGYSNALLLERNGIASGGTGRSCAVVRTHYSVLSNTQLALGSLRMLKDFKSALDDPDAESGFVQSGYFILAGEGKIADTLVDNLKRQRALGANTEEISSVDAAKIHPLLDLSDVAAIGFEPDSGYADPHLTTTSLARAARRRGASLQQNVPVTHILVRNDTVQGVRTPDGEFYADIVISAVGPWTQRLMTPLGIDLPMANTRHTVFTIKSDEVSYSSDLPIVKDLTVPNKMYFRPEAGTILVGSGDRGDELPDPDELSGPPDPEFVILQAQQVARRVPSFGHGQIARSWFGAYDVTPDWNPVIDRVPSVSGLYLAFGFSGHGFKLAPMLGKAIAQLGVGAPQEIDISPYRWSRFNEGEELVGAYGVGSIS